MCSSVNASTAPSKKVLGSTLKVGVTLGYQRDDPPAQALCASERDGCVEREDRRPDPLDRGVEVVDRELHSSGDLRIENPERGLQGETDREQLLDDRVVEIHCDALAVLEQCEVPHSCVQPSVVDRDTGSGRERDDEFLVDVAERVF